MARYDQYSRRPGGFHGARGSRSAHSTHDPRVVPIHVAEELLKERDALAAALQRARKKVAELEEELVMSEEANIVETHDIQELQEHLRRLQGEKYEVERERDALLAARREPMGSAEDVSQLQHQLQQLAADLANTHRRREEEIRGGVLNEQKRMLHHIGELRDTVARALQASTDPESPWHAGLVGILQQVDHVLTSEGVTLLGAPGEPFDPHFHQALGLASSFRFKSGEITEVERPGFLLADGTIARSARVIVAK